jgi:hypothetical protein
MARSYLIVPLTLALAGCAGKVPAVDSRGVSRWEISHTPNPLTGQTAVFLTTEQIRVQCLPVLEIRLRPELVRKQGYSLEPIHYRSNDQIVTLRIDGGQLIGMPWKLTEDRGALIVDQETANKLLGSRMLAYKYKAAMQEPAFEEVFLSGLAEAMRRAACPEKPPAQL